MEIIKSEVVPLHGVANSMQGGRSENQDDMAFVDTELGLLVLVCDGMGGGPGGKTASYIVKYEMVKALCACTPQTPRDHALKMAASSANDALEKKMQEVPALQGMGSTFVAALISKESAYVAHAGDSRCYLLRGGKCVYRSNDHSLVGELVRKKALTEEEARRSPQSNVITRGLGSTSNHVPEIDEVPYRKGDRFVLCTDGVWGSMPQADLLKRFTEKTDLQQIVSNLSAEIDNIGFSKGGYHDNHTMAIVDMDASSTLKPQRPWRRIAIISAAILAVAALVLGLVLLFAHKKEDTSVVLPSSAPSGYPGQAPGVDYTSTKADNDTTPLYDPEQLDSLRASLAGTADAAGESKDSVAKKTATEEPAKEKADPKDNSAPKDKTTSKDKASTKGDTQKSTPQANSTKTIESLISSYEKALKVKDRNFNEFKKKVAEIMGKVKKDVDELEKQCSQTGDAQCRDKLIEIKTGTNYPWDKHISIGEAGKYYLNNEAQYAFKAQIDRLKALQDIIPCPKK